MKIHDISMMIHKDITVYNNNEVKKPVYNVLQDHNTHTVFESEIKIGMHTGTHVDAPLHMIKGGDTIENINLYQLITPCRVIDFTNLEDRITKEDLEAVNVKKDDFLLFKTRNSYCDEFDYNFVFLDKSGAEYLRDIGIKGVGTDALGIERSQPDHSTHTTLLGNNIMVVEGLRLGNIQPGEYKLIVLPLKILGAEGAPARAVLIEGDIE